jgi:hypothetical protein
MTTEPIVPTPLPLPPVDQAIANLSPETRSAERAKLAERGLPTDAFGRVISVKGEQFPTDPAVAKDYAAHGVSQSPQPADYSFNLGGLGLPTSVRPTCVPRQPSSRPRWAFAATLVQPSLSAA